MRHIITWHMGLCDVDCMDCISACPNDVLYKDDNGLLCISSYGKCVCCESCYNACKGFALYTRAIRDNSRDTNSIEYFM